MSKQMKDIDDIIPLTIVRDNYNGAFSGGKYTAWNLYFIDIPEAVYGGDCEHCNFWYDEYQDYTVGIGDIIEEAALDLMQKLNNKRNNQDE